MELRHLRYFVAVAENLSFTRAARELGTAQPPLSVQIRNLESELGTSLFHRTGKKITLTPAGNLFLKEARSILQKTERVTREIQDASAGRLGSLHIAMDPSALSERLTKRIRKFLRKHSGLKFFVEFIDNQEDISTVGWDVHLSCTTNRSPEVPLIEAFPAALAVPAKHRLAERDKIDPCDLSGEILFVGKCLLPAEATLLDDLRNKGIAAVIARSEMTWNSRLNLVSLGMGLCPCSAGVRASEDILVRPIASELPQIETVGALNSRSSSPAAQAFLAYLTPE